MMVADTEEGVGVLSHSFRRHGAAVRTASRDHRRRFTPASGHAPTSTRDPVSGWTVGSRVTAAFPGHDHLVRLFTVDRFSSFL